MNKTQKIAYGCVAFFVLGLVVGAVGGKFASAIVGGLPFLLAGLYFIKKNSDFQRKIKTAPNSWNFWNDKIHFQEKQLRKQRRALYLQPYTINPNSSCAEFVSNETGEIYNTSLISCTCESYKRDMKPCKHMYCLAYNLGVFTPDSSAMPNPAELEEFEEKTRIIQEFSKLDRETQRKIAYEHFSSDVWSFVKKEDSATLLSNNLLCTTDDLSIALPKLTKGEMSKILDSYNIAYEKNATKPMLMAVCLDNKDVILQDLKDVLPVPIKLNKQAEKYLGSLRGKYANMYAENYE